jgi:hypothetical protein
LDTLLEIEENNVFCKQSLTHHISYHYHHTHLSHVYSLSRTTMLTTVHMSTLISMD